jgi:hypothetical protein
MLYHNTANYSWEGTSGKAKALGSKIKPLVPKYTYSTRPFAQTVIADSILKKIKLFRKYILF